MSRSSQSKVPCHQLSQLHCRGDSCCQGVGGVILEGPHCYLCPRKGVVEYYSAVFGQVRVLEWDPIVCSHWLQWFVRKTTAFAAQLAVRYLEKCKWHELTGYLARYGKVSLCTKCASIGRFLTKLFRDDRSRSRSRHRQTLRGRDRGIICISLSFFFSSFFFVSLYSGHFGT